MQSPSTARLPGRGLLAVALFALGAAPALAQPRLVLGTTGALLPDGRARLSVAVTNNGDDFAGERLYLYDALPGVGIVSWAVDSPTPDQVRCAITTGNAPDPAQAALECDIAGMGGNQTRAVTVTSIAPLEPGCTALVNEAHVYFPRPASIDHQDLPPPSASASYNLVAGLCEARMSGGGAIVAAGGEGANAASIVAATHAFDLRCRASDHRQALEVDWPRGNAERNAFRLVTLTSANCVGDPAVGPQPPPAGFDTFIGEGWGWCNGDYAYIAFAFTDAGNSGAGDTAEYQIFGEACVLDTGVARLGSGRHQAQRN